MIASKIPRGLAEDLLVEFGERLEDLPEMLQERVASVLSDLSEEAGQDLLEQLFDRVSGELTRELLERLEEIRVEGSA